MNVRTKIRKACFVSLLSAALLLSGCSSREEHARDAFNDYQAALATGSLPDIRDALLALVAADEDEASHWIELGKVQLQLGDGGGAYSAFERAHELDRSNLEVLRLLTQLSLRAGALSRAEEHAKELVLLAPDDPAVKMTQAYVALRRGHNDEAEQLADAVLAQSPYDPAAKILRARVLLRTDRGADAVRLLEDQLRQQPSDVASLHALVGILDRRDDWPRLAGYGGRVVAEMPDNVELAALAVSAALRTGQVEQARQLSLRVLGPKLQPAEIKAILDQWQRYGPPKGFAAEAAQLAAEAVPGLKPPYAAYLNRTGAPEAAARAMGDLPRLPVTAANQEFNVILAASLGLRGQIRPALERLGQVLAIDPNHAGALEERARLFLRMGQAKRALVDAERLVALTRAAPEAHILLANIHLALGQRAEAGRVLWNAFHQISSDRNIYEALRVFVARTGDSQTVKRLDVEFGDQRDARLAREFV